MEVVVAQVGGRRRACERLLGPVRCLRRHRPDGQRRVAVNVDHAHRRTLVAQTHQAYFALERMAGLLERLADLVRVFARLRDGAAVRDSRSGR